MGHSGKQLQDQISHLFRKFKIENQTHNTLNNKTYMTQRYYQLLFETYGFFEPYYTLNEINNV